MTRIIGILNYKGGTGKTTTLVNLAAGLALRGDRVLCVDLDAQGSLASYLGTHSKFTLTDLLTDQVPSVDCVVHAREGIDLITSDQSLLKAEGYLWRKNQSDGAVNSLSEKLHDLDISYDYVLLDCSPSISLIGVQALTYAEEIIVPVTMNYLSMVGIRQVMEAIKMTSEKSPSVAQLKLIVPTFYLSNQRKDREMLEGLAHAFPDQISNVIRSNIALSEACSQHASIYEYAPNSNGASDYARLVEKVASYG